MGRPKKIPDEKIDLIKLHEKLNPGSGGCFGCKYYGKYFGVKVNADNICGKFISYGREGSAHAEKNLIFEKKKKVKIYCCYWDPV